MEYTEEQIREYMLPMRVKTYDVGPNSKLKLSALLRVCQEVSERHLESVNMGYTAMKEKGLVFLIISNAARICRLPFLGEELQIRTHPRGTMGVQFYRDYEFWSGEELLIRVMQTSVSVDPVEHKILRPKVFLSQGVFFDEKVPREEKIDKITPQELPQLGVREIRYSDVDYNHHLNNTIYGDIAMDFLPEALREKQFAYEQIDYVSEALLGETLRICGREFDGGYLVQGYHERGLSFSALMR